MFNWLIKLSTVLYLVTVVPHFAHAGIKDFCVGFFKKYAVTTPLIKQIELSPSVEVIPAENGYIFQRLPSREWFSPYAGSGNDVQGNPTRVFSYFGEEFAAQLGFKRISADKIFVPDVATLNKNIQRLNQIEGFKLNPIVVSFYEAPGITESFEFLSKFVDKTMLPISTNPTTKVHDYTYHVGYLLATQLVVEHLQKQVKLGLLFIEFLLNKKHIPLSTINYFISRYSNHLDVANGNYARYFETIEELQLTYRHSPLALLRHLAPKNPEMNRYINEFEGRYFHGAWMIEALSDKKANEEAFERLHQITLLGH